MITEIVNDDNGYKTDLCARMSSKELEKILAQQFDCHGGTTKFEVVVGGGNETVTYRFTWKL